MNRYASFSISLAVSFFCFAASLGITDRKKECSRVPLKGKIIQYGLASAEMDELIPDRLSPSRYMQSSRNFQFQKKTSRIPLVNGNIMFFDFVVFNFPKGKTKADLRIQVNFPEMTNFKGEKFTTLVRNVTARKSKDQNSEILSYQWMFLKEFPFEMVEGEWSFQVLHQDCEILKLKYYTFTP